MKRIKQCFLAVLALFVVLSCCACGKKPAKEPASETPTVTDTQTEQKNESQVKTGDNEQQTADNGAEKEENTADTDKAATDTGKTPVTPTKPGTSQGTGMKWEEFYALSAEEKDAYKDSFESMDAFYDWMVAAQEQFTEEHPDIEIGAGGVIDLSKLQ